MVNPGWHPLDIFSWTVSQWAFFGGILVWGFVMGLLGVLIVRASMPIGRLLAILAAAGVFIGGWIVIVYFGWC